MSRDFIFFFEHITILILLMKVQGSIAKRVRIIFKKEIYCQGYLPNRQIWSKYYILTFPIFLLEI